jgi:16S rRNA (uracil1498-N3)-methyltransferase
VSAPRFLADDVDPARGEIALAGDESHHLARVLRLKAGDEVVVFDGRGRESRAVVVRSDPRHATVRVIAALTPVREPPVPILLVQSVLKGDKMDDVIRDATMAGAAHIVPIVSARSQVRLSALERSHALDRWHRIAIASAKQCRRARLPIIDAPQSLETWLASTFDGLRVLLAEPEAADASVRSLRSVLDAAVPSTVACVVGPEGGWAIEERELAVRAGCIPVSLGTMTLRADAAGLVAVVLVQFALQRD